MSSVETLERADLTVLGLLPGASNRTLLVTAGGSGPGSLAVYKPASGEAPLWDYSQGTLHRREAAAYEIARALGWPSVPATVLREGPEGPGAVQAFVDAVPGEHFFSLREGRLADFRPFALFDALINNGDRKGGHLLLGRDGQIWGIDHGVSLGVEPNLRTVIWEFAGDPIPGYLMRDVERVVGEVRSGELGSHLAEILSAPEAEALRQRGHDLLETATFPEPGPERPFPWPLI